MADVFKNFSNTFKILALTNNIWVETVLNWSYYCLSRLTTYIDLWSTKLSMFEFLRSTRWPKPSPLTSRRLRAADDYSRLKTRNRHPDTACPVPWRVQHRPAWNCQNADVIWKYQALDLYLVTRIQLSE